MTYVVVVSLNGTEDGSAKVGRTPPPLPEDVYVSAGGGNVIRNLRMLHD